MPTVYAFIRKFCRITGAVLNAAFGNPPEAYYRNYCRAVKAGVYGG